MGEGAGLLIKDFTGRAVTLDVKEKNLPVPTNSPGKIVIICRCTCKTAPQNRK